MVKNSEILLVNPVPGNDWDYDIRTQSGSIGAPLGLLSIGSLLHRAGFKTRIIDESIIKYTDYKIEDLVGDRTLFVGLSVMTTQVHRALTIAKAIRRKSPKTLLVWGGIHPTLFPEQTLENPFVDIIVLGEGEYVCLELARSITQSRDLREVAGIMFKGGGIVFTGKRELHPLDGLPYPVYELLDVEKYINRRFYEAPIKGNCRRTIHIQTGMGCPFKCTFCINTSLYGGGKYYPNQGYRGKSADRILGEIDYVKDKLRVNYINFRDELFFANKTRFFRFLDGLEKGRFNVNWFANIRADYFTDSYITEGLFERMAALGCSRLGIGAESGSERVLEMLGKRIKIDQLELAAKYSNKYKVTISFSFMIGLPSETWEDMLATLRLINRLKGYSPYTQILGPQIYRPYPGCELFKECVKLGLRNPQSLEEWGEENIKAHSFLGIDSLPWIDPKVRQNKGIIYYLQHIGAYCINNRTITRLVIFITNIRAKFNFWRWPYEGNIVALMVKIRDRFLKR